MTFTWFVFICGFFILTMVFMNFLIAVIGDTYSNVIEYKVAHDYQQRAVMIYEREVHFTVQHFEN